MVLKKELTANPGKCKNSISKIVFKVILYAVVLAFAFFQCFGILEQYLCFQKSINLEVINEVNFPGVTICNQIAVGKDLQLPNSLNRIQVLGDFYEFLILKNVTTSQQYYETKWEFVCSRFSTGFENWCTNGTDLIFDGGSFFNYNGTQFSFDYVCQKNHSSLIISRHCNCKSKREWACLDYNNSCISIFQLCDGYVNCLNGIDEVNCMGEFILDRYSVRYVSSLWKSKRTRYYVDSANNFIDESFEPYKLIKKCFFQSQTCLPRVEPHRGRVNWEKLYTSKYGTCFTAKTPKVNRSNWILGKQGGLRIELDHIEINRLLTTKSGHRIILHDPREIPVPEKYGFDIPVDSMIQVAVNPVVYKRLGQPWGVCHGLKWDFNGKYTTGACETMCRENFIREKYNCYDYITDLENITEVLLNYKPCSQVMASEFQKFFIAGTNEQYVRGINCGCLNPCFETIYGYTIHKTETDKETQNTLEVIQNFLKNKFGESRKVPVGYSYINVYLESTSYHEMNEHPSMSFFTFLSNIGGLIGIFIGISVLNIADRIGDWVFVFTERKLLTLFRKTEKI